MNDQNQRDSLLTARDILREFVAERDWSRFHTPKNLATALSVEASELLEPFQWLNSGEATELGEAGLQAVRHEMADVLAYLVQLADRLDVDLRAAFLEKMAINRQKYPAEKVFGDSRKYSDYEDDHGNSAPPA
ncbi:nucleotide pyrophosphohydrolase [Burkholderia gladioli]|uniref:nucleotide pyrophosphohydrolase n=1 Tax=Burkholderia gladioli TaxID=28095 RepID=UPI00163F1A69|nr:nucleotide pyrophosphohydrolase [Burkholderia gladioli]